MLVDYVLYKNEVSLFHCHSTFPMGDSSAKFNIRSEHIEKMTNLPTWRIKVSSDLNTIKLGIHKRCIMTLTCMKAK